MFLRNVSWTVVIVALLVAAAPAEADTPGSPAARAIALYDAGDYAAALSLLEQLDASGLADGPALYRLAFARARTGDREGGTEAQQRAVVALESEYAADGDLEVAFYLSNAYRNLGRTGDSRRIAAETTTQVESGTLVPSDDPLDLFRVGKLYEDQGLEAQVEIWYGRAVDGMADDPEPYLGSLRWALRHLGNLAFSRADYDTAVRRFETLVALDGSDPREWDQLASSRARLRDWAGAEQAWRKSEAANPADGDRPRYCGRLAAQAASLVRVPTELPDGRAIGSLTKEDLEAVLAEQAGIAGAVQAELPEGASLTESDRQRLQAKLDAARAVFIAAGLEYGIRNHPLRETAFFGGYAPLIFHAQRWTIPE